VASQLCRISGRWRFIGAHHKTVNSITFTIRKILSTTGFPVIFDNRNMRNRYYIICKKITRIIMHSFTYINLLYFKKLSKMKSLTYNQLKVIGEKIAFQIKEYSFSPILRYLSKIWLSLAMEIKKKCTLAPHAQPKLTQHTIGIFRSFFPHASIIINLSTNLESYTTYTWKKSIVYHQFLD